MEDYTSATTDTLTGADLLCEALLAEDVRIIFGHPGGAILPFYDALYGRENLRHVLTRHEQAAAHAADGYARATGRTGVCVATSGPGATNLVTGLATAQMDSVPVVAITGQVATGAMGTEAFQETDILGVTMPVTKHGFLVQAASDLPWVVSEAFRLARSGRPGPVLIDVPKDVQAALVPVDLVPRRRRRSSWAAGVCRHGGVTPAGQSSDDQGPAGTAHARGGSSELAERLDEVASLLNQAQRPIVIAGRGVILAGVSRLMRMMAERADLPVATTLLGLDAFPADHPLATGLPGMHGTERANQAIQNADLVLGLGLRFDDRIIGRAADFAPKARIVHFDVDPASVGRTLTPDLSVVGDLRSTLPELARRTAVASRAEWRRHLQRWSREAEPQSMSSLVSGPLGGRRAIREVARRISETGAVVVTDVGQHQMWLAQELPEVSPRSHLTSGGLGTMGYALPAAIGAALAQPGRPVWVVAGDGGFQMNLQELATVVQEEIPLRIVVINNGYLGMVRQWQECFYDGRYSSSALGGPDLVALAGAYGIPGFVVERAEDLEECLDTAQAVAGPVLLDFRVVREENVYPLVPPNAALDELVMAPEAAVAR